MSAFASMGTGVLGGIMAGVGALISAPDKVKIPDWVGIDPEDIENEGIESVQRNASEAAKAAREINEFEAQMIKDQMELAVPGGFGKAQEMTTALMKGEVPKDVQDYVLRSGAARGLQTGFGGSPFSANLTARDLGLTSLQMQETGFQRMLQLFNPFLQKMTSTSSFFLSPQQRASMAMWNAEKEYETRLMKAEVDAQPSRDAAAWGGALIAGGSTLAGAGFAGFGGYGQSSTKPSRGMTIGSWGGPGSAAGGPGFGGAGSGAFDFGGEMI